MWPILWPGLRAPVHTAGAFPHEITLVGETPAASFAPGESGRLVGDRAYDSDPLDGIIDHSDQGAQYMPPSFGRRLEETAWFPRCAESCA